MLAVPFSAIGAVWLMWALGYNVSIAAWVGMIALLGLDAETAVFMLLFLDLSWQEWREKGLLTSGAAVDEALVHPRLQEKMDRVLRDGVVKFLDYVIGHPGVGFTTCLDYVRNWRIGKTPSLPADAGVIWLA